MNEVYQAKLSGSPPQPEVDQRGDIHIQPHPLPMPHSNDQRPQGVPVHLPNIYVTAPTPERRPAPRATHAPPPAQTHGQMIKIGPFHLAKPHPLLWLTLAISLLALVLEVPKGSLPTLTGRHRVLRNQERLVQERLHLLSRLSTFLPPPLAHMLDPHPASPQSLDLMRFWNANAHTLGFVGQGTGAGAGDRWWSIEDLGQGASVVRSKGDGTVDREVWVLRLNNNEESSHTPLLNALTHSLVLRERLLADLASAAATRTQSTALSTTTVSPPFQPVHSPDGASREEREYERERRKRDREREKEVEEREREVSRREKWVVEEMRKLTEKVHTEASELTLEDRITERLKAYQRQLAKINLEREGEQV